VARRELQACGTGLEGLRCNAAGHIY
jgi:hypothetical protein